MNAPVERDDGLLSTMSTVKGSIQTYRETLPPYNENTQGGGVSIERIGEKRPYTPYTEVIYQPVEPAEGVYGSPMPTVDTVDVPFVGMDLPFSTTQPSSNGHKLALEADAFQVGQTIRYRGEPVTIFQIGPDYILAEKGRDRHAIRIAKEQFENIKVNGK